MSNNFGGSCTSGKEFFMTLAEATKEGLSGIYLTNSDPEADYKALIEKNRLVLDKFGLSFSHKISPEENGVFILTTELRHRDSGQYEMSMLPIRDLKNTYFMQRLLCEGLLGVSSKNDAIEAELFGPKRKHREHIPLYDNTAEYIEFDFTDQAGNRYKKKVDRKEFEKSFLGMTTEEEAVAEIEVPMRRELSYSDIKLFMQCKRCFFNAKKLGIKQPFPDGEGFELPKAVDAHLKKIFDWYREQGKIHPIMPEGLKLLKHEKLKKWQTAWSFEDRKKYGVQFDNVWKNYLVYGGVDDAWINDKKELIVVEYKSMAKQAIYPDFKNIPYLNQYKKQIEFYAWLFKKRNYSVCSTGYLLLCNAITNNDSLDLKLEFELHLLAHEIDDSWVQETIDLALQALEKDVAPLSSHDCKTCKYFNELSARMRSFEFNK